MKTEILEKIGFTRGEIKVYLALIELGESSIGPLSKKSGVTPAKVYGIIEKLKGKGLITTVIKSDARHFQAFNPDRLLDFLEDKEKEVIQQKNEIRELIPGLVSKQGKGAEQNAQVYETIGGIRALYDEIIEYLGESKEDFIGFTLGDEYENTKANMFFKNYDAKRRKLGIKIKLLALKSQMDFLKKKYGKDRNIEIRYSKHSLPTGLIIFGDRVATLIWGDVPTAFVIQSKQNADVYRKFFSDVWKSSAKQSA